MLESSVHLFFLDELSPISLRDPFLHSGSKAGIFLQETQSSFFQQTRRICAPVAGNLLQLRFLLGSEMYFHAR